MSLTPCELEMPQHKGIPVPLSLSPIFGYLDPYPSLPQPPPPGSPLLGMGGKNLGFREGSSCCMMGGSPGLSECRGTERREKWGWGRGGDGEF